MTVHREQSVKREKERKNQQDATIRYLLLISVSTCFGHHHASLQENKDRVTVYGVLLWFSWMWLVAVVLMFVESQTVHIQSTCKVCNKNWECCSIK